MCNDSAELTNKLSVGKGSGEIEAITAVPSGVVKSGTFGADYQQGSFRVGAPAVAEDLCQQSRVTLATAAGTKMEESSYNPR